MSIFSTLIWIDESTDCTDTKFLCLLIRYYNVNTRRTETHLLEMLPLHLTSCTAEKMFGLFRAETERIFSIMKDIKCPNRNCLADHTFNGIMTYCSATRDVVC